jgi:hypothetical protein
MHTAWAGRPSQSHKCLGWNNSSVIHTDWDGELFQSYILLGQENLSVIHNAWAERNIQNYAKVTSFEERLLQVFN